MSQQRKQPHHRQNENKMAINKIINIKKKKSCATRKLSDSELQKKPRRARRSEPLDAINKSSEDVSNDVQRAIPEKRPLHAALEELHVQPTTIAGSTKNVAQITKVNTNRQAAGSNWNAAGKAKIHVAPVQVPTKTEPTSENHTTETSGEDQVLSKSARQRRKRKEAQRNKYVAMDCEMVGVGHNGQFDMLARVSIVNKQGDVLLDKYVKPREIVTDYRTSVSGIRPRDIEQGEEFDKVQSEVIKLLQGKVLVGHAIRNDLAVLQIKHPVVNIRDTSRYKPLSRLVSNGRTPSLKRLAQAILGIEIQMGEHSSVEDAHATMSIYNKLSFDWEFWLQNIR